MKISENQQEIRFMQQSTKREFLIEKRKEQQYNFDLINTLVSAFYIVVMIVIVILNKDTTFLDLICFEMFAFPAIYLPYIFIKNHIFHKYNIKEEIDKFQEYTILFKKQNKEYKHDQLKADAGGNIIFSSLFFILFSSCFLFNQSYHLQIKNSVIESELQTITGKATVNHQCETHYFGHGKDGFAFNPVADRVLCHKHHQHEPFSINGFNLYAGSDFYDKHSSKIDNQKLTVSYKNQEMVIGNHFFMFSIPLALIQNDKIEKPVVYEIKDEWGSVIFSNNHFTKQYKKQRSNYLTILIILSVVTLLCVAINIYANWKFYKNENFVTIKTICEN